MVSYFLVETIHFEVPNLEDKGKDSNHEIDSKDTL